MVIKIILIIAAGVAAIFGLITALKFKKGEQELIKCFTEENCILFGAKGAGKDLIFNKVINCREQQCYANIPYNKELCVVKDIRDLSVAPNDYKNILNDDIKIIPKINKECCDYYISDGGIFLPSQYSGELVKNYPSLPIYYALSRHLTNSNIHINTQYLGRVWDKLREQAAYYIRALHTTKLSITFGKGANRREHGVLITSFIVYDNYQSALSKMRPFENKRLFEGSEGAAAKADFLAKHGNIKEYKIIQYIGNVHYDSRHFHKRFYGYNSPDSL